MSENTGTVPDWSDRLTVFVLTVGDERNLAECLALLEQQTVRFHLETISDVAPMSARVAGNDQ